MPAARALLLSLGLAAPAVPPAEPLLRLALVEQEVDVARDRGPWRRALEGQPLLPGESLRTASDGLARVELPWMALTLSSGSRLRFPDALVLSLALDDGRAVVEGERLETLKLVTPEAEVRGRGRAIVRRERGRTLVTCLSGQFRVAARRGAVTLAGGQGTAVDGAGAPTSPGPLPEPPAGALWPGRDAVYVAPGEPLELRWPAGEGPFQVELLPVGREVVLRQRDVAQPPLALAIPWPGAFRWRVSRRDARGLEGRPSAEGLIAVDR
jgi:hypothetical protein